jgi:hypothetical protein
MGHANYALRATHKIVIVPEINNISVLLQLLGRGGGHAVAYTVAMLCYK